VDKEEARRRAIKGRDLFNEQLTPLRDEYPKYKKVQDAMNRDINKIIYPEPPPPPPPPPPTDQIKFYHFDGLGIFLDVLAHGEDALPRIDAVIAKAASYGVSAISYFSYLHTGRNEHKHLNWKTPWLREGDKFQLDVSFDDSWYYDLHRKFLAILKKYNIKPIPQGEMWRYTKVPYEINVNGVNGFLDAKALQYQKLGYKPVNEAAHAGSDRLGHLIANWHRSIWLAIKDRVKFKDLIIDVSHSEFASAELVYHGTGPRRTATPPYKPKDYRQNCNKCGKPWGNKKEDDRIITFEQHRCSIFDDLHKDVKTGEDRLNEFLRSASRHIKFSEDGSQNPKATIIPFPGEHWRLGDADQIYEMVKHGSSECKRKGKDFYWGIFPMESLLNHSWGKEEYYDVDTINWDRFEAGQKGFKDGLGL